MQFPPASCYFLHLRPKQLTYHPICKDPQLMHVLLLMLEQSFVPYKTTGKIIMLCHITFIYLGSKLEGRILDQMVLGIF